MVKKLSFRETQLAAYEVLKKIAEICDQNGWRYFLAYGSLIGAIRHNGIIPWDDDIDILMPRPDYDKLRKYFNNNAKQLVPLKLFDPEFTKNYPHMISRVSDMRYKVVFNNEKDYGIGAFVDIYPLDGVGNNYSNACQLVNKTKVLASLCFLTSRKGFAKDNTISKTKMLLKIPAYVWANFKGNRHYINKLSEFSKVYKYEESKYVACLMWPAGRKNGKNRDVFKKEVFRVMKHKFEDKEFNIPEGYDKFLKTMYGNYMVPPDKAGKKTNHNYKVYHRQ